MPDKPLDIDETVAYLREKGVKVTKKSLYSQVSRRKQPRALKIGRALRFTIGALDDYVQSITTDR
jgi:predicted DNA-binding transcriptional regulator AlpA